MIKRLKLISIITLVTIITIFLSGCNRNSMPMDEHAFSFEKLDTSNLKVVTLRFFFQGTERDNAKEVLKEVEKLAYRKLKVKLKFTWLSEYQMLGDIPNYESEICVSLASGFDGFDGFLLSNYKHIPDFSLSEFAKNGYIKDISHLIKQYAPKIYGKLTNEQIQAASYNGSIYAVPNLVPKAKALYAVVREDLRKKYNIPEIKNYSDYEDFLRIIKEKEKGITVPAVINIKENSLSLFANSYDYSIFDQPLQLVYKKNDPKMIIKPWDKTEEYNSSVKKLMEWCSKNYIEWFSSSKNSGGTDLAGSEDQSLTDMEIKNKILSGYTASTLKYENFVPDFTSSINPNDSFGYVIKDYQLYPDKKVERESPIDGCMVFNAKSPNVDRALMFLDWIQSDQKIYDLFMFGRKGKEYTLEGRNYALPQGCENVESSSYLGWQGSDAFKNMEFERFIKGTNEGYAKKYINFINSYSSYSRHTGFSPYIENVAQYSWSRKPNGEDTLLPKKDSSQMYERIDDLNIMDSNIRDNISFNKDIIEPLNAATSTIIKEIQSQLDSWNSSKKAR